MTITFRQEATALYAILSAASVGSYSESAAVALSSIAGWVYKTPDQPDALRIRIRRLALDVHRSEPPAHTACLMAAVCCLGHAIAAHDSQPTRDQARLAQALLNRTRHHIDTARMVRS